MASEHFVGSASGEARVSTPDGKGQSPEMQLDRYQTRSMILTSQLPVARWHEQIGDPTLADGILDRL